MRCILWRFLSTGLLILLCLTSAPDRAAADPGVYEPGTDPGLGFNLISWWNFGGSGASTWENAVQSIHDAGFTEVSISPVRFAQTSTSASQSVGTILPTSTRGPELSHIAAGISRAKSLGMRVTVNPFVGMLDGTMFFSNSNHPSFWRGFYDPSPGSAESITFWNDYEDYLVDVAQVAEANRADSMLVGTELKAIVQNSGNNGSWSSVISAVDSQFSGELGYAANWDNFKNSNLTSTIWENPAIDFVGIDAYFRNLVTNGQADASGAYPDPTFIAQMESAWNNQLDNDILPFAAQRQGGNGLPVEFTELGYLPYNRTSVTPQGESGALDTAEQTMAFEGLLRALDGRGQDFLATHIWTWGMTGTSSNLWDMGVSGPEPNSNNVQTSQWLSSFVDSGPGNPPGATQVLYSFESGLEGFEFPAFGGSTSSLAQVSGTGNTDGDDALAVTKTGADWTWDARVIMNGSQLQAMQDAIADNINDYILEMDVTYVAADLPGNLADMNMHVSFQSQPGSEWGQVFPFADIGSPVDQLFHVEIPLSAFAGDNPNTLVPGISGLNFHLGFAGSFSGNATVYIDRIALTDTTFVVPENADFDEDGDIDGEDFLAWQAGFGITSGALLAQGDANNDGAVDDLDLDIWEAQFGTSPLASSSTAVPEPAAALLMTLAGFCLAGVRKFSVSYRV